MEDPRKKLRVGSIIRDDYLQTSLEKPLKPGDIIPDETLKAGDVIPDDTLKPGDVIKEDLFDNAMQEIREPSIGDSFNAGISHGVSNMMFRSMGLPGTREPSDIQPKTFGEKAAWTTGKAIGDVPWMVAGAFLGGMGGAMGLPAGLAQVYEDLNAKGRIKDAEEFKRRALATVKETAKGEVLGAAGGLIGKAAAPAVSKLASEAVLFGAGPQLLEGRMPTDPEEIALNLLPLAAFKGVGAASKLKMPTREKPVKWTPQEGMEEVFTEMQKPEVAKAVKEETPTTLFNMKKQLPNQEQFSPMKVEILTDKTLKSAEEYINSLDDRRGTVARMRDSFLDTSDEFYKRFIRSGDKMLRRTKAGTEIADAVKEVENAKERVAGNIEADMRKALKDLTEKERINVSEVMEKKAEPMNEKVDAAAKSMRFIDDVLFTRAKEAGLTTKTDPSTYKIMKIGDKYHIVDSSGFKNSESIAEFKNPKEAKIILEQMKSPSELHYLENHFYRQPLFDTINRRKADIIRHLIETGQVKKLESRLETVKAAELVLDQFVHKGERRTSALQFERQLDLPDWAYEKDPLKSYPHYIRRSAERIVEANKYGPKDEWIEQKVNEIAEQGGDAEQARRLTRLITGREFKDSKAEKLAGAVMTYNVLTKMGLSQLGQVGQLNNAFVRTNAKSVFKAVKELIVNKEAASEFLTRCGTAINEEIITQMQGIGGTNLARSFLKKAGFTYMDMLSRRIAALSGRFYAEELAVKLSKNPNNKYAQRRFEQFDLSLKELKDNGYKLTDDMSQRAAQKAEIDTNFRNRVLDSPEVTHSVAGKIITQFQKFSYFQTKFIRDFVIKEAYRGNLAPLIKLVGGNAILGFGVNAARSLLSGRPLFDEKDETKFRYVKFVIDSLAVGGALGILDQMLSTAKYGFAPIGPLMGDITRGAQALPTAFKGNIKPLAKELYRKIPFVGTIGREYLFGKKEKEQFPIRPISEIRGIK